MTKRRVILLSLVLASLLAVLACWMWWTRATERRRAYGLYDQVQLGMTLDEVKALLGDS
jgi:hypothetical protein